VTNLFANSALILLSFSLFWDTVENFNLGDMTGLLASSISINASDENENSWHLRMHV
jgi:hypothetical protein